MPFELNVDGQGVFRGLLASRKREPDGPLGISEGLHRARPIIDVMLVTVVQVVHPAAPVGGGLRDRLRPARGPTRVHTGRGRGPHAGPEDDADALLRIDVLERRRRAQRFPVDGYALHLQPLQDHPLRRQRADEPMREAERRRGGDGMQTRAETRRDVPFYGRRTVCDKHIAPLSRHGLLVEP